MSAKTEGRFVSVARGKGNGYGKRILDVDVGANRKLDVDVDAKTEKSRKSVNMSEYFLRF